MKSRNLMLLPVILLSVLTFNACRQQPDQKKLQSMLESTLQGFHGTAGVYVYYPRTGLQAGINMDTLFPTASMIKVPILCTLWGKIYTGALHPDSTVKFYADSLHYPWKGEDALGRFAPGEDISIRQLMTHMITFSDNHASIYLQELAGSGNAINNWLAGEGFVSTRVNSRVNGRQEAYAEYGWGQTTPREMASLFLKIRNGEVISPAASEAIYRHLTRIYWNGEALSQIPPYVQVASKQGAVDQSRSETVLVNAPHGDYVFCVITKNQQDTSWTRNNEGYVLIRRISSLLWNYFEPDYGWKPGAQKVDYLP